MTLDKTPHGPTFKAQLLHDEEEDEIEVYVFGSSLSDGSNAARLGTATTFSSRGIELRKLVQGV